MPGGLYRQQITLSPIVEVRESPFSQSAPTSRRNLIDNPSNEKSTNNSYFPGTPLQQVAGFPGTFERHNNGLRGSFGSMRTSSTVSDAEIEAAELADEAEEHAPDSPELRGAQGVGSAPYAVDIPNFSLPGRGSKRPVFPNRFGHNKVDTVDWAYAVRGRRRRDTTATAHWRNFSLPSNAVIRRASA